MAQCTVSTETVSLLALSNTCGVEASIDASTHCDAERQQ